jgi:hypothetical protein
MRRKRNAFTVHPSPAEMKQKMSTGRRPPVGFAQEPPPDLAELVIWWTSQDEARDRFRWALRDSIDELLDGERTGHWCYQHFGKTEKTHLGTVIELNLGKEFGIESGTDLDWAIAGADLDCKFSKNIGGWEIPMEMYLCPDHKEQSGKKDHAALVVWVNDDESQWAAGLVRITDNRLKFKQKDGVQVRQYNRDNKRHLSDSGMDAVYWLWGGLQTDLPENVLLQMDDATRSLILNSALSGQKRVNELFKNVTGKILSRHVINTVGQQDDAPKRVRDARQRAPQGIRSEGYLILGHLAPNPKIAKRLELPVPEKGEWVSVRVVPVGSESSRPSFVLDNVRWAAADPDEWTYEAPTIPKGTAWWIE